MWIVLGIVYIILLLLGRILWRRFYKRHELYHFHDRKVDMWFRWIGHRQLLFIYSLHMILLAVFFFLLIYYVW